MRRLARATRDIGHPPADQSNFPARIHHGTAIIVLKECAKALQSLEMKHEEFLKLALRSVQFRGEFVTFYRWVRELPTRRT